MAKRSIEDSTLTDIADAIREKGGTTETQTPAEMPDAILALSDEPVLQTKTVSPSTSQYTVQADSGYDGLSQVTVEAMPTAAYCDPTIEVSSSGVITATATVEAGYMYDTELTSTKNLTTQAAKTITPSTSAQTAVAKGRYTTGAVTVAAMPTATLATPTLSIDSSTGVVTATVSQDAGYVSAGSTSGTLELPTKGSEWHMPTTFNYAVASAGTYQTGSQVVYGDSNLIASNIKSGTSIFGVTGTYEGSSSSTASNVAVTFSFPSGSVSQIRYSQHSGSTLQSYSKYSPTSATIAVALGSLIVLNIYADYLLYTGDAADIQEMFSTSIGSCYVVRVTASTTLSCS